MPRPTGHLMTFVMKVRPEIFVYKFIALSFVYCDILK